MEAILERDNDFSHQQVTNTEPSNLHEQLEHWELPEIVQSPTSNQTVTKKLLYYTFFTVVRCSLPHNTTQCFNNCQVAVTSRSEVIETKGMSANQYCNYCSTATSLPSAMPGYKATLLLTATAGCQATLLPASPPPHLHCKNTWSTLTTFQVVPVASV